MVPKRKTTSRRAPTAATAANSVITAPLELTTAEKNIIRGAQIALIATAKSLTGVILTLATNAAQRDYWASMTSWCNRNLDACDMAAETTTPVTVTPKSGIRTRKAGAA